MVVYVMFSIAAYGLYMITCVICLFKPSGFTRFLTRKMSTVVCV